MPHKHWKKNTNSSETNKNERKMHAEEYIGAANPETEWKRRNGDV